jgi:amino acid permease
MKLLDTLLLALTAVFLIIAVHQTIVNGLANSYWLYMIMLTLFFFHQHRKNKNPESHDNKQPVKQNTAGKGKKSKKR